MGGCCTKVQKEETEQKIETNENETTKLIEKKKKKIDFKKTNINQAPIIEIINPVTPVDLLKSWDKDNLIRSPELLKRSSYLKDEWKSYIYCGINGILCAINTLENKLIWKKEINNSKFGFTSIQFSLGKEGKGKLIIIQNDELYCLNNLNGEIIWNRKLYGKYSMLKILNDYLYISSTNGIIQCIKKENGEEMWKNELNNKHESNLIFELNKNYLYSSFNGSIFKIDLKNGNEIWKIKNLMNISNSVCNIITLIINDKILYCFIKGIIHLIDIENGKLIKKIELIKNPIYSSMSVLKINTDNIIIGYIDKVYCFDLENNEIIWKFDEFQQSEFNNYFSFISIKNYLFFTRNFNLFKIDLLNGKLISKIEINKKRELFHTIANLNNNLFLIHQFNLISINSESLKQLSIFNLKSIIFQTNNQSNHYSISSNQFNLNFNSQPILQFLEDESIEKKNEKIKSIEITKNEIEEMFEKFKNSIKLKNKKYHLKTYKDVFTGSEATDLIYQLYSLNEKENAISIGKSFLQNGYISHVTNDHTFKNTNRLFYKIN
eukprot:gene3435-6084_t